MWHVLHLIARPIEVLLGLFCLLTAILLYPTDEGKIQSKLEDVWVRVDDYKLAALSKHTAFMKQVAQFETYLLNRLFGNRLISSQSIVVSLWCSLISYKVGGTYLATLTHVYLPVPLIGPMILSLSVGVLGSIFLKESQTRTVVLTLSLSLTVLSGYFYVQQFSPEAMWSVRVAALSVLAGGFCCDLFFIIATRFLVRLAGEVNRSLRLLGILFSNVLLAVILVGPAFVWYRQGVFSILQKSTSIAFAIAAVSMSNLFDGIVALLFVLLALILIVHRSVWPLLTRTLFRMADIGTKGRRAILTTVGIALLGTSVFGGKFPELMAKLIEKFGG